MGNAHTPSMSRYTLLLALTATAAAASRPDSLPRVLVTGATGRTGAEVYRLLKADPRIGPVSALVRNLTKAAAILNCTKCDPSEGVFQGDVTEPDTLKAAFAGVDVLAIAVGSPPGVSKSELRDIEFGGVENQLTALMNRSANNSATPRVVFCSSAQTTNPNPPAFEGGVSLFWKLNAEAFIGSTGVGSTIVKPCGLDDKPPSEHRLVTAHDDKLPFPGAMISVSRNDVARVMVESIARAAINLRFDLCAGVGGKPTLDANEVLLNARWPWQTSNKAEFEH